jgi:hypothetical protein
MSHRSSVSAIVPLDTSCTTAGPPGPRFQEVATQTGGRILNICAPDYGPLLDRLAVLAGGPQREFRLGETPANPSEIEVRVNGAVWDRTRWHFDDPSNSVVFETDWIPVQGQQIEVRYLAICA